MVESLVPLILEHLCEERWDSRPPRLQSLPALTMGAAAAAAAAAADSVSFVSASWLRQWLQRDLEGSEEGAHWDSISASGDGGGRAEAPPHFTSGRLWGAFVRLILA